MTIPTVVVNSLVLTFSLLGIIYFIVMAILNKILGKLTDDDLRYLVKKDDFLNNDESDQEQIVEIQEGFGKLSKIDPYRTALNQIDNCLMQIYIDTIWRAVVFTMVIWLIFTVLIFIVIYKSWFIYHDTYLQSFLATFFGILSAATTSFIAMKFSSNAIARSLVESKKGRYFAYASTWISASAIGTAIISFCLFYQICFEPLNEYLYLGDGENPPNEHLDFAMAYHHIDDKLKFQHLYLAEIGFALAIVSCSVFMRDIPQILGSGLIVGHDLAGSISSMDETGPIELTLKKTSIICQILYQNVVLSLDTLGLISTFLVGMNLLTSYTTLRANYMDGVFQFPILMFSIILLVCIGVSSMALGHKKEDPVDQYTNPDLDSIPTFTANQIRLKLIIINSICFVVFLILPLICLPDQQFDILRDQPLYPFFFTNAIPYSVILCLELGLFGQTLILIISEHFTSHSLLWTRNSGKKTMKNSSNGMLQITRNATLVHLIMISTLALLIFISYSQAGFYGVALLGIAFIISPSFFLSLSIFSFLCQESGSLANYSKDLAYSITERLYKMQWAAINYQIFQPLLNTSGMFIINLVMIGLYCVIGQVTNVVIMDALVIYGFLMGSIVSYFIKSQNVYAIKCVALDTVTDKENSEKSYHDPDKFKNVFHKTDPAELIITKLKDCQLRMITNILICTLSVLLISFLFGQRGLVGYMSGLNLVAIHMIYLNIIKLQMAKNVKIYNEAHIAQNSSDCSPDAYSNTGELYITLFATESDSLMIYTLFNILFILQGARILTLGGFLAQYMEEEKSQMSNTFFNNTIGQLIRQSAQLEQDYEELNLQIEQQLAAADSQPVPEHEHEANSDELNRRLRELRQQDQIIIVRIQEDNMALRDIQNNENAREATIIAIQRSIERSQADQAVIRGQMREIMGQISAINSGQAVHTTAIEQVAMLIMSY